MSEDKIVKFSGVTRLDMPPHLILEGALKQEFTNVVILAYDKDGEEYFASSMADGGTVLWLLERLKKALLETPETHFNKS